MAAADREDASVDDATARRFEEAMLPHLPDCLGFAISLARDRHDAEDLVQETFLKAQRAFGSFTPGTNAKAWLFTILRRLHIDRYRRRRLRPSPRPGDELEEMAPAAPPGRDEADDAPWDELPPDAVLRAVEALPEPFRLAVRLRDLDGLPYREIALILDVPEGTVMSRLHRGREWVRARLVEQLKGPPETRT